MSQLRFKFVEDGLTQAGRNIADYAGDCATDRVLRIFGADDALEQDEEVIWRVMVAVYRTFVILSAVSKCGHLVGCLSTSSRVTVASNFLNSSDRASWASSLSSLMSIGTRDGGATVAGRCTLPTDDTNATISIPYASLRYLSAMAPAATRPACPITHRRQRKVNQSSGDDLKSNHSPTVSLALLRPPPLLALTPYFSK